MNNTREAIKCIVQKIDGTPFLFFSGKDIQSLIFKDILKEYDNSYPTNLKKSKGELYWAEKVSGLADQICNILSTSGVYYLREVYNENNF